MIYELFFIGLLGASLSGCISGPKNPDQKLSEKMRADSYDSADLVMGVPVLTRKPLSRKISGHIQCGEGLAQRPANHAAVNLFDKDKVVSSASTDVNGNYKMSATIYAETTYQLKASSKCGTSAQEITLKEDSIHDLTLKN